MGDDEEHEAEGVGSVDNDGRAKGLSLGWVLKQI